MVSDDGSNNALYSNTLLPASGGFTGYALVIGSFFGWELRRCFLGVVLDACALALLFALDDIPRAYSISLRNESERWRFRGRPPLRPADRDSNGPGLNGRDAQDPTDFADSKAGR